MKCEAEFDTYRQKLAHIALEHAEPVVPERSKRRSWMKPERTPETEEGIAPPNDPEADASD